MEHPKTIAFVINVSELILPKLKEELSEAIKHLDIEDAVYTYHPDNEYLIHPGLWTKQIMDFQVIKNFDIRRAIKECADFCGNYYYDESSKHIFVFLEHYSCNLNHELKQALKYEARNYDLCYIHVFGIGKNHDYKALDEVCEIHPRCIYERVEEIKDLEL